MKPTKKAKKAKKGGKPNADLTPIKEVQEPEKEIIPEPVEEIKPISTAKKVVKQVQIDPNALV